MKQRDRQEKKEKENNQAMDKKQLYNVRVIQRNLVYVIGVPPSIATVCGHICCERQSLQSTKQEKLKHKIKKEQNEISDKIKAVQAENEDLKTKINNIKKICLNH